MCWSFIKRYLASILSGAIIIVFLTLPSYIWGELHPVIVAVGGLLFTIPIRLGWQSYLKPVLEFKKDVEPILFTPEHTNLQCIVQRIIVKNSGRSVAKNCKGYVIYKEGKIERKERVCWMVPKERPNATINQRDNERLDFCAFLDCDNVPPKPYIGEKKVEDISSLSDKVIAPTEEKWDLLDFRSLTVKECKVLVTADNADPVEAKIEVDRENRVITISPPTTPQHR